MYKKVIRDFVILLGIGVIYYIFISITGIRIPCFLKSTFGFKCGTCGITRMMVALIHLDFVKAFHCNPFMFITLLPVMAEIAYLFYIVESQKKLPKWNKVVLYTYFVLLIGYGVLRNFLPI